MRIQNGNNNNFFFALPVKCEVEIKTTGGWWVCLSRTSIRTQLHPLPPAVPRQAASMVNYSKWENLDISDDDEEPLVRGSRLVREMVDDPKARTGCEIGSPPLHFTPQSACTLCLWWCLRQGVRCFLKNCSFHIVLFTSSKQALL